MLLLNKDVEAGSFVCSRSGSMFLVLEVVRLSRNYVGLRYICSKGSMGGSYMEYSEEALNGVFITDCVYMRTEGGSVTAA